MFQAWSILTIFAAIAVLLVLRKRGRTGTPDGPLVRGAHALFLISVALLALSSLVVGAFGARMHGWMLLLHMSVAPLFLIAIAVLALIWAQRTSMCVRLILLSAFVAITSAMFMMMTWFGTDWQRCLLNVHRISAMVLTIAAAAQAGRSLLAGKADAARTGD
jgi:hypothetical protein